MTANNMAAFRVVTMTLLCLFTLVRAGQNEIQKSACSSDSSKSILKNDQLLNLHSEARAISGTSSNGEKYLYYIGVCVNPRPGLGNTGDDCMVIQYNETDKSSHCLGKKSSAQVTETYELGWVELLYGGGDLYHTHCDQNERKSRVFFFCDQYSGKGDPEFIEENRSDDYCYYLFNWPTIHLCPYTVEPGWVLIIILVCLLVIWSIVMIIGFLVKRFILGAKGIEQIPFVFYYKEFGELEAEGCDLVCRCNKGHKEIPMTTIGKQTTVPSGLAETETESEDENKDEDLIPM